MNLAQSRKVEPVSQQILSILRLKHDPLRAAYARRGTEQGLAATIIVLIPLNLSKWKRPEAADTLESGQFQLLPRLVPLTIGINKRLRVTKYVSNLLGMQDYEPQDFSSDPCLF